MEKLLNKKPENRESVSLWRLKGINGLELMRASYTTRSFPRHIHEGFGVGVIEAGALGFYYRGDNLVAPAGAVNLVNPGEVHTGHAAEKRGWTYRMFYLDADLLKKAASQMTGKQAEIPFFFKGVIHDPALAAMIHCLHRDLEQGGLSRLEKESRLLMMLSRLIIRHADDPPAQGTPANAKPNIARVQDYMNHRYDNELTIDALAQKACLSPYHFIRLFHGQVGLPPHAYLMQIRTIKAKQRIAAGASLADAALESGFTDQSHLSRHFKRLFGYTPGKFSNCVQD